MNVGERLLHNRSTVRWMSGDASSTQFGIRIDAKKLATGVSTNHYQGLPALLSG
jgi:hypothetical protein